MKSALSFILLAVLCACGGDSAEKKPQIGFVTNGVASFWVIASKGVEAAEKEFDVDAEVHMPGDGVADQKRIVQALLTRGVDGIAATLQYVEADLGSNRGRR